VSTLPPSSTLQTLRAGLPAQPSGQVAHWLKSALVHGGLLAALFIGVQWKTKHIEPAPVQVEIFSAAPTVQKASPTPAPAPVPAPPKTPVAELKPDLPPPPKVDIAVEKKVERKIEKVAEKQLEKQPNKQVEKLPEKKPVAKPIEKVAEKATEKPDDKKLAEVIQKSTQDKEAEAKKQLADEKAQSKLEEKSRDDALKKIIASASTQSSGSGNTTDKNADKSGAAGNNMDAGYINRLRNMIRSNTVFQQPENMQGNPKAEFIVSLMPDCTLVSVRLKKSSGLRSWDDAAERAISRINQLPRPSTGSCASSIEVSHQPKD
jgi:colicin import membrane protein